MGTLALKLVLTPILIMTASLASRRWGQAVGGWLVGLPLTSGPIAFFIAMEQGTHFAARAAEGSLVGTAAQAGFSLAYSAVADRSWAKGLLAGSLAFVIVGALLTYAAPGLPVLVAIVAASLALSLYLMPASSADMERPANPPGWDLPARMAVATALVLTLTALAPALGPRLSGLLATFPIFATVLAVFAHRHQGAPAARRVLRGLLAGLVGFASVFLVLRLGLEPLGIAGAYIAAVAVGLTVQLVSLHALRRGRKQHGSA